MYEYHYKVMNIIIRIMNFNFLTLCNKVSSTVAGKMVGKTSTTFPGLCFTSALIHSLTPTRIYMKTVAITRYS